MPPPDPIACRHAMNGCSSIAIAQVACPEGCVCFPADWEQWLCAQHTLKGLANNAEMVIVAPAPYIDVADYPRIW